MRFLPALAVALCAGQVGGALAQTTTGPGVSSAWLPRGGAELQVLDKITARGRTLELRDGAAAQFGSLSIALQSCLVRPPDQPPDAAAFLVITDSHPDAPRFRGWMFHSDPSVSMLQHPIYDVRVLGCRG